MISRVIKQLTRLSEVKVGIFMMALAFAVFFANFSFLESMSLKISDINFKLRGPVETPKDIVVVAIDQKSQEKFGRWPWSRTVMVDLIDRLSALGAVVIGLDIVFSYPEERPDRELAESLMKELQKSEATNTGLLRKIKDVAEFANVDKRLARAFKGAGNVIPGYFFFTRPDEVENLKLDNKADYRIIKKSKFPLTGMPKGSPKEFVMTTAVGVKPNIKMLTRAAYYSGFFNMIPDEDGVVRTITNVIKFNKKYFPSLSMQMMRYIAGNPPAKILFEDYGIVGFELGKAFFIPSDEFGRTTLNYYGPQEMFPYISVADVLEGGLPDDELLRILQDKVVLVGATATGIGDIRNTPFGRTAGVELHATFIQNVIDGTVLQRAGWFFAFDAGSILVLGLFLTIAMRRLRVFSGALLAIVLIFLYVYFQRYMFMEKHSLLDVLYPIIAIILVYGGIAFYKYFVESREKKQVRKAFEHYLSPVVIGQIMEDPAGLQLGGEEVVVSAFFSDVAGFSTFSEKMSPQELVELLNEYLTAMTDIIMDCGGTLDKYEGDAIVCFFGAPVHHADHAIRACRAALLNDKKLAELREKWASEGKEPLFARIGVNSGKMVVGNMGSTQRFDYTMLGDEANLAARLEGANKQYGTYLMISESTYGMSREVFEFRELDLIRVVGRSRPVRVYELLEFKGELGTQRTKWYEAYYEAYGLYRQYKFDEAVEAFETVMELDKEDQASWRLLGRCRSFINNPPDEDWDGVFSLTQK